MPPLSWVGNGHFDEIRKGIDRCNTTTLHRMYTKTKIVEGNCQAQVRSVGGNGGTSSLPNDINLLPLIFLNPNGVILLLLGFPRLLLRLERLAIVVLLSFRLRGMDSKLSKVFTLQ